MTRPAEAGPAQRPDPSRALEAGYRLAAERLRGLPIFNEALHVEAVGFRVWEGQWLGVVITPWFMNLTLAPADPAAWHSLPVRGKRKLRLPAGNFEFIGAEDPQVGEFQTCSLFSPMGDFADQEGARLVAQLSLQALFDPAHAEAPPAPPGADGAVRASVAASAAAPAAAPASLSKRDFLRGRLGGSRADGPV